MARIKLEPKHTAAEFRSLSRSEPNARARMRMLGLAEIADGTDLELAAERSDMSDQALRDAIKRYNAEGLAGLYDRERPGRPPKLDPDKRTELGRIALKGPDVEADGLSAYTRDDLAGIAKSKWGTALAPTTVGRILRECGLSRQKARPSHPKKNEAAAEALKKDSGRPAGNRPQTS